MIQTGRDCQRLKVEEGVQLGAYQDGHCYAGHDEGHVHKSENRADNHIFCTALAGPVSSIKIEKMKSTQFDLSVIKESIFTKNSELNVLIIFRF